MLLHSDKTGESGTQSPLVSGWSGRAVPSRGICGLALSAKSAQEAVGIFFLAVILVVLATYCLFIAGSIALFEVVAKKSAFL